MQQNSVILKESITLEQKNLFIRYLEAGKTVKVAATLALIPFKRINELLDLLNDSVVKTAINLQLHNEICTSGKALAWFVAKKIMRDKKAPTATRWAAAKWTMEASGEGIGNTRQNKSSSKELHEMTDAELLQVIAALQDRLPAPMITLSPSPGLTEQEEELI